jgi:3-hydroxyacyl-CoA dehydrogenase
MRVGILGSGLMGGKLGTIFARAGHKAILSYARREQKLKTLARNAKGQPSAAYAVIRCRRKYDSTLSPRPPPARRKEPARVPRRTAV